MKSKATYGVIALLAVAIAGAWPTLANAQSPQQQIINNVIQNVLQDVRDQIQSIERRGSYPTPGALRFSAEEPAGIDLANPFALTNPANPLNRMAYAGDRMPTKAPPPAPPAVPVWLYGFTAVGGADSNRSTTAGLTTTTTSENVSGAFDITKIGIFTSTDALTLVLLGSGVFSESGGFNNTTTSFAGSLAYTNGGFSANFTANPSWTRGTLAAVGIAGISPNSSAVAYTGDLFYKFDLASSWFIEPNVGFTYTDLFDGTGTHIGDSTEVHGGARVGTEWKWGTTVVQASFTGIAYGITNESGITAGNVGHVGGRESGKLNFVWNDHFSSYVEVHSSGIDNGVTKTDDIGGTGGLRWTW